MQNFKLPATIRLCLLLFFLGASSSWAGQDPASIIPGSDVVSLPPDIQRIKEQGRLVVSMFHQDRPPFFYTNDQGRLVGLDVELASDIARLLGVKVEFNREAKTFDEVVDRVLLGQADVAISKVSITMARALRAAFTDPYVVFHHTLLINRLRLAALQAKNPEKTALELLTNLPQKIAVRQGTAWVGYAEQQFPKAEIVLAETMDDLLVAVRGEAIALLYDEFEIKKLVHKHPELNIDLQTLILGQYFDPIGIAVSPANQHLLAWLNLYLRYNTSALQENDLWRDYGVKNSWQLPAKGGN